MSLSTININGVDYEAYASVSEADAILYVDPVRRGSWNALEEETKGIYLVAATDRLDLLSWRGKRTNGPGSDSPQDSEFPRTDLVYSDGTDVPDDEIPDALERACALLAGSIAERPNEADHGSSAQSISKLKAGSVEIEYFRRAATVQGQVLQDETALALVRQWVEGSSDIGLEPIVSGVDAASVFSDRFRYDRTGY